MGKKTLLFGLSCIFLSYYTYIPMPENVEEPWKVRLIDTLTKIATLMATLFENIGLMKYEEVFFTVTILQVTEPVSDENITVVDTTFSDIPVRLYLPKRKSERQRPAIIFIHGGAFVLGSCSKCTFNVCVCVHCLYIHIEIIAGYYRLAPQHHFPAQFEDGITAVKYFLQDKILRKYGVDPMRVAISGDSSGGTLAAAVTQQVQIDPEVKHKLKLQALLYPGLQVIDTSLPSHRDNEHGIVLTRDIAIKLVSLFFTKDEALPQAMRKNQHMPLESRHLFRFVNWTTLLPDKYRKDHEYTEPVLGRSAYSLPALMDPRALPLLADDARLQHLPRTYILTCQYDVLRDDGIMYVSRLQNVGVPVFHDHVEDGIHGALSYMTSPLYLQLGLRIKDMYVSWMDKNL
ncbi:Arylacetamide deacetylase-like 2 [Lemmus lemmus]